MRGVSVLIIAGVEEERVCRLVAFVFIGPVKVIGRKNGKYNGRLLIASNHQYQFDFSMVSSAVPVGMHYMTVTSELKGLRGVLGAWTGAFGVDPTIPGGAEAAAAILHGNHIAATSEIRPLQVDHLLLVGSTDQDHGKLAGRIGPMNIGV